MVMFYVMKWVYELSTLEITFYLACMVKKKILCNNYMVLKVVMTAVEER